MNFLKTKLTGGLWTSPKLEEKKEETSNSLKIEDPDETNCTEVQHTNYEDRNTEERNSLWKILSSKIGSDVSIGISLPVSFMEPVSVLQRQCELIHFQDLLTQASQLENSLDRLAWVAVFACTIYNGTERFGKPFNPILGETFEWEDPEKKVKAIAEQVSHHPPISAIHVETSDYVFWQDSRPKTKFLGNSIELETQSKTHIYFPKTRDHFTFSPPVTRVNNLIIGKTWVDHFGVLNVTNLKTAEQCTLNFEKCGWLGKGRHELNGYVKDTNGNNCLQIFGKWTESVSVKFLYENGKEPKDTTVVAWRRPVNNAIGKYRLTEFCLEMNNVNDDYEKLLPLTDSRLRPDRRAFERGDLSAASSYKHKLEEKQRADKRNRTTKNEEWTPRWFKEIPDENGKGTIWVYCGDYWEQRTKKQELLAVESTLLESTEQSADISEELQQIHQRKELLLGTASNRGFACDFSDS